MHRAEFDIACILGEVDVEDCQFLYIPSVYVACKVGNRIFLPRAYSLLLLGYCLVTLSIISIDVSDMKTASLLAQKVVQAVVLHQATIKPSNLPNLGPPASAAQR